MKTSDKFKEYIWLVGTIHKAGRITFAEIQQKWLRTEMSGGTELARSTFNRHKDAIEDIFGIYIDCDRTNGYRYSIGNPRVLEEESMQKWMLSTLSMNNILSESLTLQPRILLEPVPSEGLPLRVILDAMKRGVHVAIAYRRYGEKEERMHVVAPYCLKLFKQRWYVLTAIRHDADHPKAEGAYLTLFSLDRIVSAVLTEQRFTLPPAFDAKQYFEESFGALVDVDVPVEDVCLRAYSYERYKLRDLPIHSSQEVVEWTDTHADFRLRLRPTSDLIAHLCSRGKYIKVTSPAWMADEVKRTLLEAAARYDEPCDD